MKRKKPKAVVPPWTPFQQMDTLVDGAGNHKPIPEGIAVLKNSRYMVEARLLAPKEPFGEIVWLSIKRIDREIVRDWRDLQRIKNEILGPDIEAVEIFPKEARLVDTSNQYHLWCFPDGYTLPFGYNERLVTEAKSLHPLLSKAVQRPFDDGNRPADLADPDVELAKLQASGWKHGG